MTYENPPLSQDARRKARQQRGNAVRRAMRAELIDLLGGRCCVCGGYEGDYHALHIHHLGDKKFSFAASDLSWSRINADLFKELRQCVCLCLKCHREFHAHFTRDY